MRDAIPIWASATGDPLTIVAGSLHKPFPVFLALIVEAKIAPYLALAALRLEWMWAWSF
jgi:membrane protein YqaA with SNARE-associated domain